MKSFYLLTSALFLGASLASAQLVINWDHLTDGPFHSTSGNVNASDFVDSGTDTLMSFSDTTPAFQNGSNNYTGIDNYAGMNITTDATIDGDDFYRLLYRSNDGFRYQYADQDNANTPTSVEVSYVSMFLKPDFQGGYDTTTVDFSGGGKMEITADSFQVTDLRYVVRDGSDYYISEESYAEADLDAIDPSGTGEEITVELADVRNTDWATWNPANARFDESSATFSAQTFSNVTGLGYYGMNAGGDSTVADIQTFSAAVPEPSAWAVLLGTCAFGWVLYRRRK